MADRRVVCGENEGLALYIYWKREQMMQKPNFSENLDSILTIAYRNVCDHKTPICTASDAGKVRGIGPWVLKQIKDFFQDGLEHPSEEAPQAKKVKATRRYLPQKNSAPYAILITLYRAFREDKKHMMKQELIDAAELSGLSRMPIEPSKGSSASGRFGDSTKDWYSGWSSMKTLINKGLVVKSSCPAKYMVTDEGIATAEECMSRGGLNDSIAPFTSDTDAVRPHACERSDVANQRQNSSKKKLSPPVSLSSSQQSYPDIVQTGNISNTMRDQRGPTSFPPVCPPTFCHTGTSTSNVRGNKLAIPPLSPGERFSEAYKILLILDHRECFSRTGKGISSKTKFAERLREQYKVEVEIRHLPVGDAVWTAYHTIMKKEYVLDFIVERKAVDDLWSSIKDTRYKQQKLKLLRCGISRLIYLIEGDPNFIDAAESLKTAALTTEILEGFDVQRTRDTHDTVNRYGELTNAISRRYSREVGSQSSTGVKQCMSFQEFVEHCSDVEKERVRDVFGVQLMQIRHVTEDIALSILEKYTTVLSLAQAYAALEGNTSKQENLLTGLPIQNKNKSISAIISRNVYKFIWAP